MHAPPDCWAAKRGMHADYVPLYSLHVYPSPCRAGCAGNWVHPDIFNATKHNGPVALAMSQAGLPISSQTVLPPGLSSVDPRGNVQPGTVSIPGWSSVPPRLVRKILSLEFVDMWELLPESWRLDQCEGSSCFATLVAVLATRCQRRE